MQDILGGVTKNTTC